MHNRSCHESRTSTTSLMESKDTAHSCVRLHKIDNRGMWNLNTVPVPPRRAFTSENGRRHVLADTCPSTTLGARTQSKQKNGLNFTSANSFTLGEFRGASNNVDHVGMVSGSGHHEFLHINDELMDDSVEISVCLHSTTSYRAAKPVSGTRCSPTRLKNPKLMRPARTRFQVHPWKITNVMGPPCPLSALRCQKSVSPDFFF